MHYKNFLFDLDGTLIDSVPSILESIRHAITSVYKKEISEEVLKELLGMPLKQYLLRFPEEDREVLSQEFIRANDELQKDGVPFIGAMKDVLMRLKARGAKLAIVSNKRRKAIERWAAVMGVNDLFDCIVGSEDTKKNKPDGEPVIFCLELINGSKEETIYVGDSIHDLMCAKAAGVKSVAVDWTYMNKAVLRDATPDYWINEPGDLLGL